MYWTPLSGNLTKEGITADFEAMARVGIGGVVYIEVAGTLAMPQSEKGYFRDIAVLAMPAPGDDKFRLSNISGKALYHSRLFTNVPASYPEAPRGAVIPRERIVDVTIEDGL